MGKQQQKRPRRRNKDNNKKNMQKYVTPHVAEDSLTATPRTPAGAAASYTTTTTTTTTSSLSALLSKIRHANGQTRLAALSALQQNVLLGQQQNSSNNNNSSSTAAQLWQAVREQVLDPSPDLAIATTAATCLTEFIESSSSSSSSSLNHDPMTAGWFLVLIGRLQDCHHQLQQLQQPMSASTGASAIGCGSCSPKNKNHTNVNGNNVAVKQQQWLALSLQCLHAICALLETNPLVMERLERNASSLRNDALDTLWQWLDTASSSSSSSTTTIHQQTTKSSTVVASSTTVAAAAASTAPTPMDTTTTASTTIASHHHHHHFDYFTEIQEQACRALHSMIEDNWSTLLLPWLLQEPKADVAEAVDDGDQAEVVSIPVQLRAFTEIGPRILHSLHPCKWLAYTWQVSTCRVTLAQLRLPPPRTMQRRRLLLQLPLLPALSMKYLASWTC
jgi:hypothetical protein